MKRIEVHESPSNLIRKESYTGGHHAAVTVAAITGATRMNVVTHSLLVDDFRVHRPGTRKQREINNISPVRVFCDLRALDVLFLLLFGKNKILNIKGISSFLAQCSSRSNKAK